MKGIYLYGYGLDRASCGRICSGNGAFTYQMQLKHLTQKEGSENKMDDNGWISLHRKILTWEWYDDLNVRVLFIHCLLRANYKPKKWRKKVIPRGSFVSSLSKLSSETGLSKQEVRTALAKLEATHELTRSKGGLNTTISITNYDNYQTINTLSNTESTRHQHAFQHGEQHGSNTKATQLEPIKEEGVSERHVNTYEDHNYENKFTSNTVSTQDQQSKQHAEQQQTISINKYNNSCASDDAGEREEEKSHKPKEKISSDVIENIYQAYPKKRGKQQAIKKIPKIIAEVSKRENITKIEASRWLFKKTKLFAESQEGRPQKYIPYASTWFNSQWDDDPDTWEDWKQEGKGGQQSQNAVSSQNNRNQLTRQQAEAKAKSLKIDFTASNFSLISKNPERYVYHG